MATSQSLDLQLLKLTVGVNDWLGNKGLAAIYKALGLIPRTARLRLKK